MRIGLVDLDTSHPGEFVPIVRALGHEVVGVVDGGTVWDRGYAHEFAARHGIPHVFGSCAELAAEVDAAFLHGCDWDARVERAAPFAEAGVALLVDKPFGGDTATIRTLLEWERGGLRVTGGSSLRWCAEVAGFAAGGERPHFALTGCSGDPFDYGIHAYSMLHGLLGPGVVAARHLGGYGQQRVELRWSDGRTGMVSVGETAERHPFHATVLTGSSVTHLTAAPGGLYASFLAAVLPGLAGEAPLPPLPELVEPELAALAALMSERDGGRWVALDEPALDTVRYDGAGFAARYRAARRGTA
ncbi:hypothetical protein [Thermoactinospora rubra]|uniref:hypothetical protein n=1 Tax=Thermoactinospora rubra TaxID=1088767 RepID=UPI000A0F61E5|nr:hypothetical protein [Thermoactinospora rubra]